MFFVVLLIYWSLCTLIGFRAGKIFAQGNKLSAICTLSLYIPLTVIYVVCAHATLT